MTPLAARRFVREVLRELDLRARVRAALEDASPALGRGGRAGALGGRVLRGAPRPDHAFGDGAPALIGGRAVRWTVLAIGKAAAAMAEGARESVAIERMLVVLPDGTDDLGLAGRAGVEVRRTRHPLPDGRSVRAGERCLALAREAEALLVLVSGGASALVAAPTVPLTVKQRITRTLLASGASIQELNVVRKHLSRIKGGGLARAARRGVPILTLAASDVVGGAIEDIGSGPAASDPSTVAEARAILRRHAPAFADVPLVRTGKAPGRGAIVASPEEMAERAARELRARGLRVRLLPPSTADVHALAAEYLDLVRRLTPGSAVVRAAEPAVRVSGRGDKRGGRSTHLAALVGRDLPPDVTFLAAATDGVDGASGTAGACVRRTFATPAAIDRALRSFATGPLHQSAGTALPEAPSGHNLADLHVLLRPATSSRRSTATSSS